MIRLRYALVASVLVLSGCNGAKSKVIPTDPKSWDQISNAAKSLSEEDKKLLTSYMMRATLTSGGIPIGTTIGDALKQEHDFEEKQKVEEDNAKALRAVVEAKRKANAEAIIQAATVAIVNTTISSKNIMAGRYSDRLNLDIAVESKSTKPITGIRGNVIFKDQFGSEISSLRLSLAEDIAPGQTRSIRGYGRDLNEFKDSDQRLESIPFDKMHVSFVPEMIVFSDGTRIGFSGSDE